MMRILLFLLTTTVFSQNEFSTIDNFLYVENEIQVWSNDSIYRFNENLRLIDITRNPIIVSSDKTSSISHVGNNSRNYYLSNGSCDVYDSQFNRLSSSKNSNFFNNSSSFIRNDTIFKFGGYGFWTSFKQLIYFDSKNKDWNYYNLMIPKEFDGLFSSEVFKIDEYQYLVYGGDKLNHENSLINVPNKNIYSIDFKNSELKDLGESNIDFSGRKINFEDGTSLNLQKNSITILDWKNNTLKKYNTNFTHRVSLDYRIFMINEVIFYIEKNNKGYVLSSSEIDINNLKIIEERQIFKTTSNVQYLIYIILLFLLFIFYYLFKDFNMIRVRNHSIRYRFVVFNIESEKEKILSVLSKDQKISTNQLFEIISSKDLHPNHIYRLIPEVMNDLKKTIQLVTRKNEEVFSVSKNKKDRRISDYVLNRSYVLKK
jgi:hypothetical protein